MKIRWFGHSCFYITSNNGTRILTDPFADSVGYRFPNEEADIVTVSHNHYDHNNTKAVRGNFEAFNKVGLYEYKDVQIKGIPSFHDKVKGWKRGANIIFVMNVDGIRVCHLGDLGHIPGQIQVSGVGQIDILMVPVGGIFTVDAEGARDVVELLKPKIVIPMHYKTPHLSFKLEGADKFTSLFDAARIKKPEEPEMSIENPEDFEGNIILMNYQ